MDTVMVNSLEQVPQGINNLFRELLDLKITLQSHFSPQQTVKEPKFYTREETANILRITLGTLNEYTKTGKLKAHRIGTRVLYRESDIDAAVIEINTIND